MTRRKYYNRLLSIYILIILFFTVVIASVYFSSNLYFIDYKIGINEKNYTEQMVNNFDAKLTLGSGIYNQLMLSQSVRNFLRSPEIDYGNLIAIMDELKSLTGSFSDSGLQVAVGKPDCDIVITPECTKTLPLFFKEDVGISDDVGRSALASLNEKRFSYQTAVTGSTEEKENVITLMMSSEVFQLNQKLVCYLILDTNATLPKLDFDGNCVAVFYLDRMLYYQIHGNGDAGVLLSRISELAPVRNKFDYSKEKIGNYNYHFMQSQRSDLQFYYITPSRQNDIERTKIILNTILIVGILLALGVFAASYLTKKTYSPMKRLLSHISSGSGLERDEFSAIEHILSSLNDENNRLNHYVERSKNLLQTNLLRSMMQGFSFSQQEYERVFADGGLDWMKRDISVVIYRLTDSPENAVIRDNAVSVTADISADIYNILCDSLRKDMQCELVPLSSTRTAVIFKAAAEERLISILSKLLPYLEITFNISAVVAVSQITCSLGNIHTAFSTANLMLDNGAANTQHNILLRSDMPEAAQSEFYYPLELEINLMDHTLNTMRSSVEKILEQILTENFDRRSLPPEQLSRLEFALAATISRLLNQQLNKSAEDLFGGGTAIYTEIKLCRTREELKKTMLWMLSAIMDSIDSQKKTQSTSFAADLMEYIALNYQKDISLTDISRRFNLSASYLSTLFKNNFGENFKDYLNIYRIKKAKEIINDNKYITIKELAAMVGFNNSDTFIRVFKRYEGISPGQYISKNYKQ